MNYEEIKQNMLQYITLTLNGNRWTFRHINSNFNDFAEIYNLSIYILAEFEDPIYWKLNTVSGESLAYYLKARSAPIHLEYHIKQWILIATHFYYKHYRENFVTKREKTLYDIYKVRGDVL